jgi:AcrR family transcriptional regulator
MVEPLTPRTRILAVAAQVFAEKGFAGARVDDIARRAGVNKAMLYYHVGNKHQLYSAVVRQVMERAAERIHAVLESSDDPETRFRTMTNEIVGLAETTPSFPAIILRELASGGGNLDDELLTTFAAFLRKVATLYVDGAQKGRFRPVDPLSTHLVTVSSLLMLAGSRPLRARMARLTGSEAPPEQRPGAIAEFFADLILDGLLRPPE